MGNTVTANFEKIGVALLAQSAKITTEKWQSRATFFGKELVSTRRTYLDYKTGISEFKQQCKSGEIYGRDLFAAFMVGLVILGGFNFGTVIGRGTLTQQQRMYYEHRVGLNGAKVVCGSVGLNTGLCSVH